jgi:hypothetical protein
MAGNLAKVAQKCALNVINAATHTFTQVFLRVWVVVKFPFSVGAIVPLKWCMRIGGPKVAR